LRRPRARQRVHPNLIRTADEEGAVSEYAKIKTYNGTPWIDQRGRWLMGSDFLYGMLIGFSLIVLFLISDGPVGFRR